MPGVREWKVPIDEDQLVEDAAFAIFELVVVHCIHQNKIESVQACYMCSNNHISPMIFSVTKRYLHICSLSLARLQAGLDMWSLWSQDRQ